MGVVRTVPSTSTQAFKARLVSSSDPSDYVIFDVSPEITEETTVNYQSLNPIHMPGNIWVYQNTESRTFSLNARLVARTTKEARRNLEYFNLLRGWCQPYFGLGTAGSQSTQQTQFTPQQVTNQVSPNTQTGQQRMRNLLGAPPDVLYFYAYSDIAPDNINNLSPGAVASSRSHLGNIYKIPVVIKNFTHAYPSDVDYLPTSGGGVDFLQLDSRTGVPFPVIMNIGLSLLETHSPTSFARNFNLYSYKLGLLTEY
jgi:hypothetical protein